MMMQTHPVIIGHSLAQTTIKKAVASHTSQNPCRLWIFGELGIGKTLLVRTLAHEQEWDLYEISPADCDDGKTLADALYNACNIRTVESFFSTRQRVLFIDNIDQWQAVYNRTASCLLEAIELLQKKKWKYAIPFIMTCSLAERPFADLKKECTVVRLSRPTTREIICWALQRLADTPSLISDDELVARIKRVEHETMAVITATIQRALQPVDNIKGDSGEKNDEIENTPHLSETESDTETSLSAPPDMDIDEDSLRSGGGAGLSSQNDSIYETQDYLFAHSIPLRKQTHIYADSKMLTMLMYFNTAHELRYNRTRTPEAKDRTTYARFFRRISEAFMQCETWETIMNNNVYWELAFYINTITLGTIMETIHAYPRVPVSSLQTTGATFTPILTQLSQRSYMEKRMMMMCPAWELHMHHASSKVVALAAMIRAKTYPATPFQKEELDMMIRAATQWSYATATDLQKWKRGYARLFGKQAIPNT